MGCPTLRIGVVYPALDIIPVFKNVIITIIIIFIIIVFKITNLIQFSLKNSTKWKSTLVINDKNKRRNQRKWLTNLCRLNLKNIFS